PALAPRLQHQRQIVAPDQCIQVDPRAQPRQQQVQPADLAVQEQDLGRGHLGPGASASHLHRQIGDLAGNVAVRQVHDAARAQRIERQVHDLQQHVLMRGICLVAEIADVDGGAA
ncbi:hypothetical protein DKX15_15385, partial [Enterococcus faecium]